ncbi:MAG TPA: glucose-6-phosphate isomerase, partial [bacterium]|nr:glucose-6-phosphate isomerase [bacterium]
VGGRYSVLSAVGLFPLALSGVDIKHLLAGARDAVNDCTNKSLKTNRALCSAIVSFINYTKGHSVHNTFLFAPELESLGKWYRQLMAESLGKDGKGLAPLVSIGSTDMHSLAQLFYGGANNAITTIVTAPANGSVKVPKKLIFPGLVEHLEGKSLEELMNAISTGTTTTYKKLKRPVVSIAFEKLNAYELGYYLQFRMIEIMYLAKLMDVDAFDQPMVEGYKKETKVLLKK